MTDARWVIDYVNDAARSEIRALPADMRQALGALLLRVEHAGVQSLRAPHAKFLGDRLWELRFGGRSGIARTLYVTASGRRLVVLHSFVKTSQAARALTLARTRMALVKP